MSYPAAEATLEPEKNATPRLSCLSVTAATAERARADLACLANALRAAFPSAETQPHGVVQQFHCLAPNDRSRIISIGVRATIVLMMLGCQLLLVIGAQREGRGRAAAAHAIHYCVVLAWVACIED